MNDEVDDFLDNLWRESEGSDAMNDMSIEEIEQYLSIEALAHDRIIFHDGKPYFDWYNLFILCYAAARNAGPVGVVEILNEVNAIVAAAEAVRLNGPTNEETD